MAPNAREDVADGDVEKGSGAAKDDDEVYWHSMSKEDACGILGLGKNIRHDGLTTEQAKTRLEKYGPNALTEKEKVTLLQRIWQQVNNVLVGILVFVAVVSLIKGAISSGEDRLTNFIEVGLITFVIT
jgi:magnesium-transporting ATPase (P-type)